MENENNKIQPKILYRSKTNRVIFGVCGGLGEYFEVDSIIFRIIFLLLIFGVGSGVLIYLVLAFLIPRNPLPAGTENKKGTIKVKEKVNELVSELKDII